MGTDMEKKMDQRRVFGTGCSMLSAVIYGFNPLMVFFVCSNGGSTMTFLFYSALLSLPLLFGMIRFQKVFLRPAKGQGKALFLLGFFGVITSLLLYTSYNYISSGIATTLHFVYPTFVMIGSVLVLRQKITKGKLLALSLSLAGIVLAADLTGEFRPLGMVLALSSGLTYACYIIWMDKTGLKDEDCWKICFYIALMKALVPLIMGLPTGELLVHMNIRAWGALLFVAAFQIVLGNVLFQEGVRHVGASYAAIFSLFEPVTSLIVGFCLMGEDMTVLKLMGCVAILAGIIVITLESRE